MKLTFYGRLRDEIGTHEIDCSIPANVCDSEALRHWIGARYPALLDPRLRIAFDGLLVADATPIAGVADVAFLPPVSGG